MKLFLKKITIFITPIFIVSILGLFIIPPTPRALESPLLSSIQKDSLLLNQEKPRVILVGGSNVCFGFNSQMIKDSLEINPINTSITELLGINYMLNNTLRYVKDGDIVILALEYQHYFRSCDFTSEYLFHLLFDVSPQNIKLLPLKQTKSLVKYVPKYTLAKFDPRQYYYPPLEETQLNNSFNKYGDVKINLTLKVKPFSTYDIEGELNLDVIKKIKEFEKEASKKGAVTYVTYPSLYDKIFVSSKKNIMKVQDCLIENQFNVLGNASDYIFEYNMMFDSQYHLNKIGRDIRTIQFINDFKNYRSIQQRKSK